MHRVSAKGILSSNNGMNIYRGCTHGCIYCDARSKCYKMNHDFEDIEIKENAPELLETKLRSKRKKCMISTGAMTDPYLHIEEHEMLTRKCLTLIDKYGFGLAIQTKSAKILRDLDLLKSINSKAKCVVEMTLTTYDERLCKILEPNVSTTKERAEVLRILNKEGIPTVVWLCPILPFINDNIENLKGIFNYCLDANVKGIICFGMGLTLRDGNREYFYENLDKYFPGLKGKYIKHFGNSYICNSPRNKELMEWLSIKCKEKNIMFDINEIFSFMSRFEAKEDFSQQSLF